MILVSILILGIMTMWVPARWVLSVFEASMLAMAGVALVRRVIFPAISSGGGSLWVSSKVRAVGSLLGGAAAWGAIQIFAHRSVYELKTWESVLGWTVNLAAFLIAAEYAGSVERPERRERFLRVILIFAFVLSIVATFTVLTSPVGVVFWKFDLATGHPTLGPFVYRNQYAAFVEAVLPIAIVWALLDSRRTLAYTVVAAVLFASVVAGGSRAGSILCLAEIVATPLLAFASKLIPARTLVRGLAGSLMAIVLMTAVVGWETIWNRMREPNAYSVRAELVRSSMEMVRDRPWMGFGLGTWSTAYPAYAHFDDGNFVNQAHNDWAQWAAEGGVPFFLILLAMVAISVRPALRSLWGIGVLSVFVHCLVDYPMQQRPALAAFFFAMLGAVVASEWAENRNGRRQDRLPL